MCKNPELVEFPCEWRDDGQDDFEELGIKPSTHKGSVFLDVHSIDRMNDSDEPGKTTLSVKGCVWVINLTLSEMKRIVGKCGVSIKTPSEILARP